MKERGKGRELRRKWSDETRTHNTFFISAASRHSLFALIQFLLRYAMPRRAATRLLRDPTHALRTVCLSHVIREGPPDSGGNFGSFYL